MNPTNPLSLLKNDHDMVKSMLEEYKKKNPDHKLEFAKKINENLAIHMNMEEKYFYSELEKVSEEGLNLSADAIREHEEVRGHIKEIALNGELPDLDKHISMIEKIILHHIEEEEEKIFPFSEANFKDSFTKLAAEMVGFKVKAKGEDFINKLKTGL